MIDTGGQLPFEGSAEIAGIVAGLIKDWKVTTFVETGTQRGVTALWATEHVGRVITIEVDVGLFEEACVNLKGSGVYRIHGDSAGELQELELDKKERVLFFLDAHSMQGTPIQNELCSIGYLMGAYAILPIICIHDIEVPGHPELGFDHYEDGTVLNLERIKGELKGLGMDNWNIQFNNTPDGAARGFCYITPKER